MKIIIATAAAKSQDVSIGKDKAFQLEFLKPNNGKKEAILDFTLDFGEMDMSGDTDLTITEKTTEKDIVKHLDFVLKSVTNDLEEGAMTEARRDEVDAAYGEDEDDVDYYFDVDKAYAKHLKKFTSSKDFKKLQAFVSKAPANAKLITQAFRDGAK